VRTLQQRLADFTAKGLEVKTIADPGEIAKGLIDLRVNYVVWARHKTLIVMKDNKIYPCP